jgi:hypothetical protein
MIIRMVGDLLHIVTTTARSLFAAMNEEVHLFLESYQYIP